MEIKLSDFSEKDHDLMTRKIFRSFFAVVLGLLIPYVALDIYLVSSWYGDFEGKLINGFGSFLFVLIIITISMFSNRKKFRKNLNHQKLEFKDGFVSGIIFGKKKNIKLSPKAKLRKGVGFSFTNSHGQKVKVRYITLFCGRILGIFPRYLPLKLELEENVDQSIEKLSSIILKK